MLIHGKVIPHGEELIGTWKESHKIIPVSGEFI